MYHIGQLKARLAKLRRDLLTPKGGGGGVQDGFDVKRTGDARIGLVGFPSVGKSTLLTKMTGTFSLAAEYDFTTVTTVPGIIKYKGAKLQMLDLPGIIEGAYDGRGKGRQVIAVARTCDVILIVLDALRPLSHKKIIERELEKCGLRLNKKPPPIIFKKRDKGGINLSSSVENSGDLDIETVRAICSVNKINSADIRFDGPVTEDELIDVIEGNRIYVPCIYVLNKIDQITIEELDILYELPDVVPISAFNEWNLDELLEKIWQRLDFIRIYTKPKGSIPDFTEPVILRRTRRTVGNFCDHIHRNILNELRHAIVWGSPVKFVPQRVGKDHVLEDEDVVQIVKRI